MLHLRPLPLKLSAYAVYLTLCLLLTGCTNNAEKLGINSLEWDSYSKNRKKTLLTNYASLAKEHELMLEKSQKRPSSTSTHLKININHGKIMFPPSFINWQEYTPIQFTITTEQCLTIDVVSPSSPDIQTKLHACYIADVLYLDPSQYDTTYKTGSIIIPRSPLWQEGFSYKKINSNGYLKFNNVTITIKQVTN